MNAFLAHLRALIALVCHDNTWDSVPGIVALCAAGIVLFFGAGTVARIIFGKDTGLVTTTLVSLLVLAIGFSAAAASLAWVSPSLAVATGIGAATAIPMTWIASKLLRLPYGPSFGILLFAVAMTLGAAYGAGLLCRTLVENAKALESNAENRAK